jgi:hypothetical protein
MYTALSYMWHYFDGKIFEPLDFDEGRMDILLNG